MAYWSRRVSSTTRGILTIAQRRGPGYFGYLVRNVLWPRAAYRFGWGPQAPALAQGVVAGLSELAGSRPEPEELRAARLLAAPGSLPVAEPDVEQVEQLMDAAHRFGLTGLAHAFTSLARDDDGVLRFADLTDARRHGRDGVLFNAARDRDRAAFNARFGTSILTESEARRLVAQRKAAVPRGYRDYAPIDFGGGLTIGQIASTDSGTGRWDFFNGAVLSSLVSGKRVLDLGCNNGSLPLMMARAGAREVVGVEFTPAIADFARLNAQILAWRDMYRYGIRIVTGDMRLPLTQQWGRFDVITAFCSLYYLPVRDMERVIRFASSMAAVLVLQANEAIDNLPAKASTLQMLMQENGYSNVAVHAPRAFARPLLVGHPDTFTRA